MTLYGQYLGCAFDRINSNLYLAREHRLLRFAATGAVNSVR